MRKIPATMATQHPDNAGAPYWDGRNRPFISVHQEITEAVKCFQDLDTTEYMWDWEGKHADAAVVDRLFSDYHDYFSQQQLGRDKFLTFRIPNIWEEKGYNLLQAMTAILSSEDFSRDLEFDHSPLFEVILPMTERADQVIHMQKLFEKLADFKSKEFTPDQKANNGYLELIPLVESVESQLGVADLLTEYVKLHEQHFKYKPAYIRTFLACSDSSLSSGLLAGRLGNKIGLARLYEFSKQTGIDIYPIMGCGSLLFRGGLTPEPAAIERFVEEFPGVRTLSLQSAFRYDYPLKMVKASVQKIEVLLPTVKPLTISSDKQKRLIKIAEQSAQYYQQTLSAVAGDMQPVFGNVPKRRDRRQHIGLLAYSRSVGENALPRAITFTSGFYSIGIPPEFIGLGRTLKDLNEDDLALLREVSPNLVADFEIAGRFLNRNNLELFANGSAAWKDIKTDVEETEKVLNVKFGPKTASQKRHQNLSLLLAQTKDAAIAGELIAQMGVLRKSLG